MRMLSLALLAPALIAASASSHDKAPVARPACARESAILVGGPKPTPSIHPLGQEPPAQHIAAVLRAVDGCRKPIVIRSEVGMPRR